MSPLKNYDDPAVERAEAMAWLAKVGVEPNCPLPAGVAYLHGLCRGASEVAKTAEARCRLMEEALKDVVAHGPCSDPDCCATAIACERARRRAEAVLLGVDAAEPSLGQETDK